MATQTVVPCAGCGTLINVGVTVNGELYCDEYCASLNVPIIGGHDPEPADHEFHPFARE